LLFRKFVVDFAERYRTTPVQLDDEAKNMLINYPWPGNVRELKNIAEQISVLSPQKEVSSTELSKYLQPYSSNRLPMLSPSAGSNGESGSFANEREILYKLFFDMRKDVTELKRMFLDILQHPEHSVTQQQDFINELQELGNGEASFHPVVMPANNRTAAQPVTVGYGDDIQDHEEVDESLNIMDKEKELIIKALKKHKGKRKDAALDLGISERTLYRKLKEYDINE